MSVSGEYLRRLIKVECEYGNMANYLNVETDHGVIWYSVDENGDVNNELPFMNANDHEGDVNLMCFGRCHSEENKVCGGDRAFHIGSLMDALGTAVGLCDGYKCTPYCSQPWFNTKDNVILDGAPAITSDSIVTCYYGGHIKIEQVKQEGEASES